MWLSSKRTHLPMQEAQETQVQYLGQEDPLEGEMVTHSSIFAGILPQTEEGSSPWGHKQWDTTELD